MQDKKEYHFKVIPSIFLIRSYKVNPGLSVPVPNILYTLFYRVVIVMEYIPFGDGLVRRRV